VRRITLLTDFGTADGYVAAMKGVIASITPSAIIDDASHAIAPGDIAAAAWALAGYWRLYPRGTTHLVVIDPGVGSTRHPIAISADGHAFVGPDNGVFTHVLNEAGTWRAVVLENAAFLRRVVSPTFHGRDVFAPVAAHLAAGLYLGRLGTPLDEPVRLPLAPAAQEDAAARGVVVHTDTFGNLITNIPASWAVADARVQVAGRELPLVTAYSDVEPGALLVVEGSRGMLEVAVRDGSAADVLKVKPGERVVLAPATAQASAPRR
jgi:S-adenosyl-L-methionine hydrolase (adenosine-forming)